MDKHVNFDFHRTVRTGQPEIVFSAGKDKNSLLSLLNFFGTNKNEPVLFTRLEEEIFSLLNESIQKSYTYDRLARTAFTCPLSDKVNGKVAIISAGTSDGFVTWEAQRTLEFFHVEAKVFEDCGVSGLWRLQSRIEEINEYDLIIAVAGMEAALVSVLSGLTKRPVIGVPTSVGYGVCENGKTALNSMLACCSPGVSVVNIDNGFGAACFAHKTLLSCKGIRK